MKYRDFYSHLLNEVVIQPNSFESSIYSAFKLALDIDGDQIGKVFEPDLSYMSSTGISTDFRVPVNATTAILGFFNFYYKTSYYKIRFNIVNWNSKPTSVDFSDYAHGKNLKKHTEAVKKLPVDTSKPLTGIVQVYQSDVKKGSSGLYETDEVQIGQLGGKNSTFDQYILPNGSFYELAKDVKKLIDKGGSKEQSEDPVDISPYTNSPTHSPELSLTEHVRKIRLTEGRKEDIFNKLKKFGKESETTKILSLDKTPSKKHALKLSDYYIEVNDIDIIASYYNRFIENGTLNNKDIFQWKTFKDFENVVDSSNVKVSKAFGEIEEKPIYEDDKIRVFHGDSKEKCIKLSNGYTFCIGRNDGGNLYNHYRYNAETTFYFVRFKERSSNFDPDTKKYDDNDHYIVIQSLTSGEYFLTVANNYGDSSVSEEEIIKNYPETKVLFEKDIIKPVEYTDRESYIMANIQGNLFVNMETAEDQILWAEINPHKQITDAEFFSNNTTDEFRKKYLETRAVDITERELNWLKTNRPNLYKRYSDIKNTALIQKIKASVRPSYLELRLATDENFVEYIKNYNKIGDLPLYSFIEETISDRGIREGKTALQFLQTIKVFSNEMEALISTGIEPLDITIAEYFKQVKGVILTENVYSILMWAFSKHDVYYSVIEFKKDLIEYGDIINELGERGRGMLYDFTKKISGNMAAYESSEGTYQQRFAYIAEILDKTQKLSNEDLREYLGLTGEMLIYFIDYCFERFGKNVKDENGGKMIRGILHQAKQIDKKSSGYFEKVKWKAYNAIGPEETNNIVKTLPSTDKINENDSKRLEPIKRHLISNTNESIEIKYVEDGQLQSDDDTVMDFWEQVHELEKTSGISILRGKNLSIVMIDSGELVGALYTELQNSSRGEEFSFDVIVKPKYRNKGLGDRLIKLGLDDYKSLKNGYDSNVKLKIDVVNPMLINTFKKHGLRVIGTSGGHTTMGY